MVAAKLSSGELPGEGSEQGAEGGGWEDLKGQRQVLRWQDAWGVRCVMDVTGSRAASLCLCDGTRGKLARSGQNQRGRGQKGPLGPGGGAGRPDGDREASGGAALAGKEVRGPDEGPRPPGQPPPPGELVSPRLGVLGEPRFTVFSVISTFSASSPRRDMDSGRGPGHRPSGSRRAGP